MLLSPRRVIQDTNKTISRILQGDLKILRQIAAYVVASGGKRIRPLFTYYLGRAYDLDGKELIQLGSLLEIVHAASLLHDDVIDEAEERRSLPTASKLHGNKAAVLAGDHLLSSGLKYLNSFNNPRYMDVFTTAIQALSTAELLQMQHHFDLKTSAAVHARVVDGKTAVLFQAAGSLVAVMRGEKDFGRAETAALGLQFGRFFQLRDDYLDYFDSARLKKKGLQDFTNGIVTRPLLRLLQCAGKQEKAAIQAAWLAGRKGTGNGQKLVLQLMEKYAVAAHSAAELEALQQQILDKLATLPGKAAREVITGEFQKILAVRAA